VYVASFFERLTDERSEGDIADKRRSNEYINRKVFVRHSYWNQGFLVGNACCSFVNPCDLAAEKYARY
jgi:hypothetical protein